MQRHPWRITPLFLLLLCSSCATTAQVYSGMIEVDARERVGLQGVAGRVDLAGPIARELAGLPGALVKVWGAGNPGRVRVNLYQVLDVGTGFAAYVGWITFDQSGVRLTEWRTGRIWRLAGADGEEFRALHGLKVWLTGLESGADQIRPLDWGPLEPVP